MASRTRSRSPATHCACNSLKAMRTTKLMSLKRRSLSVKVTLTKTIANEIEAMSAGSSSSKRRNRRSSTIAK